MNGMRGVNQGRRKREMSSLKSRMDVRDRATFEKQIKERTAKERFLAKVAKREWEFRGHQAQIFDHGVCNSGELVTDWDAPFRDPDYRAIVDGYEFLIDVKNSGVFYKCTFVVDRLQHYVSVGAFLLLFYNTNFIEGAHHKMKWHECLWAVVRPHAIENMLNDHEPIHGGPKWGNRSVIIVTSRNYIKYFKSHRLTFVGE
jgi:hypothetical protein